LAQDVFLQVYRLRRQYVPRARFKTWLYRMVTNACISEVRRAEHAARRLDGMTGEGVEDRLARLPELIGGSSEDALLRREAVDRVRVHLAQLPPPQRAALLLARGEGFSYEEVARTLSCSVSAVKSLVHRATVALRQCMRDDEEQES
jgi:RNA polymerase sigma-70 factor (ECF subfamily)